MMEEEEEDKMVMIKKLQCLEEGGWMAKEKEEGWMEKGEPKEKERQNKEAEEEKRMEKRKARRASELDHLQWLKTEQHQWDGWMAKQREKEEGWTEKSEEQRKARIVAMAEEAKWMKQEPENHMAKQSAYKVESVQRLGVPWSVDSKYADQASSSWQ